MTDERLSQPARILKRARALLRSGRVGDGLKLRILASEAKTIKDVDDGKA